MSQNHIYGKYEKALKLVGLCTVWYTAGSVMSVVGKMILREFPFPVTVTMVQLVSLSAYLVPFIMKLPEKPPLFPFNLARVYWFQMLFPLALGKFVSSVFSHISIWKVPVSYANTVKATLPLFTVFLSRVVLREQQTYKIYLSLVPIMCGVLIASVTELSFDLAGFLAALASTIVIALQNIYAKKMLREHPLHHFTLLFTLATMATTLFFPLSLYSDLQAILNLQAQSGSGSSGRTLLLLLLLHGACYAVQNVAAFSVIAMVSSLSYSVANCSKRIVIITTSLLILANPVSATNVLGMMVAIVGVLCYNKAKYDQHRQTDHQQLPSNHTFSKHSLPSNDDGNVLHSNGPLLPTHRVRESESLINRLHAEHRSVIQV